MTHTQKPQPPPQKNPHGGILPCLITKETTRLPKSTCQSTPTETETEIARPKQQCKRQRRFRRLQWQWFAQRKAILLSKKQEEEAIRQTTEEEGQVNQLLHSVDNQLDRTFGFHSSHLYLSKYTPPTLV